MQRDRSRALGGAALLSLLAACGDDPSPTPPYDASTDVPTDALADAGTDADSGQTDAGDDGGAPDGSDGSDGADGGDGDTGGTDTTPTSFTISARVEAGELPPLQAKLSPWYPFTDAYLTVTVNGTTTELAVPETGELVTFPFSLEKGDTYTAEVTGFPRYAYCTLPATSGTIDEDDAVVAIVCEPGLQWQDALMFRSLGVRGIRAAFTRHGDIFEVDRHYANGDEDYEPWSANPVESAGTTARYHVDGRMLSQVWYDGTGDDDLPGTEDDQIKSHTTYAYDGDIATERAWHDGPGDDGEWFTDDDVLSKTEAYRAEITRDGDGRVTCEARYQTGDDGLLDTADDVFAGAFAYTHEWHEALDMLGTTLRTVDSPGADGVPCTDDDVVIETERTWRSEDGRRDVILADSGTSYFEHFYDEHGYVAHTIEWSRTLAPAVSGPDVDIIRSVEVYDWLGDAEFTKRVVRITAPGPDGEWLTEDDVYTGANETTMRDDEGRVVWRATYPGSPTDSIRGPDNTWGTADDPALEIRVTQYNDDGSYCVVKHTDRGADGLWDETDCGNGATDDTIATVEWQTLDDEGRIGNRCTYDDAGGDGVWLTDDDEVMESIADGWVTLLGCTVNHWLSDNIRVSYGLHEGVDGEPFTDDDRVFSGRIEVLDGAGRVTRWAVLFGDLSSVDEARGPDGQWLTSDDPLNYYVDETFDRSGNRLTANEYRDPGPDGDWFTEDDVPHQLGVYSMAPYYPFFAIF